MAKKTPALPVAKTSSKPAKSAAKSSVAIGARAMPPNPPTAPSKELHVFENPSSGRDYVIQFQIPEFTCNCPLTGQPDFAHFTIDMICDEKGDVDFNLRGRRYEGSLGFDRLDLRTPIVLALPFMKQALDLRRALCGGEDPVGIRPLVDTRMRIRSEHSQRERAHYPADVFFSAIHFFHTPLLTNGERRTGNFK